MRRSICIIIFSLSVLSYGQNNWTGPQKEVIEAMDGLSETTAPNGNGADAYGNFLADHFSRWTIGSAIMNNKENWVEGVREWFDDGWRVSERTQQILEISIIHNMAHTRRIVTETYLGPKGDLSKSKAALSEIWILSDGNWLLYRVNVHTMPNE